MVVYTLPLYPLMKIQKEVFIMDPQRYCILKDFDKGKYILCKYDKWVSCNTVNRVLFFLWRFGDQPIGFENDLSKIIDYSGRLSNDKSNYGEYSHG